MSGAESPRVTEREITPVMRTVSWAVADFLRAWEGEDLSAYTWGEEAAHEEWDLSECIGLLMNDLLVPSGWKGHYRSDGSFGRVHDKNSVHMDGCVPLYLFNPPPEAAL